MHRATPLCDADGDPVAQRRPAATLARITDVCRASRRLQGSVAHGEQSGMDPGRMELVLVLAAFATCYLPCDQPASQPGAHPYKQEVTQRPDWVWRRQAVASLPNRRLNSTVSGVGEGLQCKPAQNLFALFRTQCYGGCWGVWGHLRKRQLAALLPGGGMRVICCDVRYKCDLHT